MRVIIQAYPEGSLFRKYFDGHYFQNSMTVIIPKGHCSENVPTMTVIQRKKMGG